MTDLLEAGRIAEPKTRIEDFLWSVRHYLREFLFDYEEDLYDPDIGQGNDAEGEGHLIDLIVENIGCPDKNEECTPGPGISGTWKGEVPEADIEAFLDVVVPKFIKLIKDKTQWMKNGAENGSS